MHLINEALTAASQWMRLYLPHIVMALVATLLIVYGENVNALVRRWIGGWNFFMRVFIFVLLCSFGYGLLATALSQMFLKMFQGINNLYLALVVVVIFIVVGILAEKKNQI